MDTGRHLSPDTSPPPPPPIHLYTKHFLTTAFLFPHQLSPLFLPLYPRLRLISRTQSQVSWLYTFNTRRLFLPSRLPFCRSSFSESFRYLDCDRYARRHSPLDRDAALGDYLLGQGKTTSSKRRSLIDLLLVGGVDIGPSPKLLLDFASVFENVEGRVTCYWFCDSLDRNVMVYWSLVKGAENASFAIFMDDHLGSAATFEDMYQVLDDP